MKCTTIFRLKYSGQGKHHTIVCKRQKKKKSDVYTGILQNTVLSIFSIKYSKIRRKKRIVKTQKQKAWTNVESDFQVYRDNVTRKILLLSRWVYFLRQTKHWDLFWPFSDLCQKATIFKMSDSRCKTCFWFDTCCSVPESNKHPSMSKNTFFYTLSPF